MMKTLDRAMQDLKQAKGMGDVIKAGTTAVGIKQCGQCKKRQEKLNKALPFKRGQR